MGMLSDEAPELTFIITLPSGMRVAFSFL